ncbi:MAG: helix-turn-helix domain-containing protein [Clostridia bacterium]|nr:helix-turn-helix domain-containing protein [Clostridia bacterium]
MELGSKIKQLRQQLSLTQEELADRCELTKGYISQLENDLTSPSITTLCDILTALGTTLAEFFKEDEPEKVVFSKEEFIEKDQDGMLRKWIIPNSQKNMLEPLLVELEEGVSTPEDYPHDGEEFGYLIEGKIDIVLGKKAFSCKKGETFYFKAEKMHYIINKGKTKAKFLWISTPPNF